MAGLLAVTLVGVVLFCLARWLLPALRPAGHRHDLDAFHVAMGLAMVAMLLARPSRGLSILTVVVAAAALGWAVARLVRRSGRPAYLRLAAGSGAMLAMVLLPATAATAAAPHAGGHGHGSGATGVALVVPLLLVALMVVAAGRMLDAAGSRRALPDRLDACCDVAMASAMGYMLVVML